MKRNEETKKVLRELYLGIAVCVMVFILIGAIFIRPLWIFAVSAAVGGAGACLQAYGIYDSLDKTLELPEKNAKGRGSIGSMFRLVLCGVLMAAAALIHTTAFLGVAVGLITLKISALMNPFIRKLTHKKQADEVIDGVQEHS